MMTYPDRSPEDEDDKIDDSKTISTKKLRMLKEEITY